MFGRRVSFELFEQLQTMHLAIRDHYEAVHGPWPKVPSPFMVGFFMGFTRECVRLHSAGDDESAKVLARQVAAQAFGWDPLLIHERCGFDEHMEREADPLKQRAAESGQKAYRLMQRSPGKALDRNHVLVELIEYAHDSRIEDARHAARKGGYTPKFVIGAVA